MRASRARYQLRQIMLAIAVLAGLFAMFGVTGAIGILIALSVVLPPILLAQPGRRLGATAWVCSIYPLPLLSSLYATWFTTWCVLGHEPRLYLDDPKYISPIVEVPYAAHVILLYGFVFAFVLCAPIMLAHVAGSVRREGFRPSKVAVRLLVPLSMWLAVLAVSQWKLIPFDHVIGCFMN